jgi:hypothetical protein
MRTAIFVFVISLLFPLWSPAQTCSKDALQRAADSVKSTRSRMLAVKGGDDEVGYNVDQETSNLIHSLKENLATAIIEYLRCAPEDVKNPKIFESDLTKLVDANKPERLSQTSNDTATQPSESLYGGALQINVTKPEAGPELIAVQASFNVGCGDDTMLLIYQWKRDAWQPAVRWQSSDYKEILGAFGDFFQFIILPQNEPGEWLVAVAHGTPWCTSRWSAYDLDLIQPATKPVPQRVIVHRNAGYIRGDVDPTLILAPGGFELRLQTGQLDVDLMTRMGVYRYRLVDNKLQRVQPIAMNGRDFVDEWLLSDWSDAIRWTASAHLTNLQNVHAGVAKRHAHESAVHTLFSYGPVRRCTGDSKHFQVEFDRDPGATTYFQIEEGENSFTMLDASSVPDPRCKGADLMPKHYN